MKFLEGIFFPDVITRLNSCGWLILSLFRNLNDLSATAMEGIWGLDR
jgi:hypothetical protein